MKNICIQEGHINIQNNSIVLLQGGTGAPGEQEFTSRIAPRLKEKLDGLKNSDGSPAFRTTITDANANDNAEITTQDFDFFLALHYDSDSYNGTGGGLIGVPDPRVDDNNTESIRIAKCIENQYFGGNTGIEDHPERLDDNITFYYMWQYLSSKTPCALLECGVGQNPHDKVILADTDRVCNAIVRGLCDAFNVSYDQAAKPITPTAPTTSTNYDNLLASVMWLCHNPNGGTSQNRWNNIKNFLKFHQNS